MTKQQPGISPYRRGADNGALFSLLLTAMFFAGVFSVKVPFLGLLACIIALAVPFFIYKTLRHSYIADSGTTTISSLWMQGIMTFACGCAVAGLIACVYLKWVDPHFLSERIAEAIEFYRNSGSSGESMARTLQQMVDARLMPTAVSVVIEMIWLGIFSGSLLSLLMALLTRARGFRPKQEKN